MREPSGRETYYIVRQSVLLCTYIVYSVYVATVISIISWLSHINNNTTTGIIQGFDMKKFMIHNITIVLNWENLLSIDYKVLESIVAIPVCSTVHFVLYQWNEKL